MNNITVTHNTATYVVTLEVAHDNPADALRTYRNFMAQLTEQYGTDIEQQLQQSTKTCPPNSS